jgi:hypothetical protein
MLVVAVDEYEVWSDYGHFDVEPSLPWFII